MDLSGKRWVLLTFRPFYGPKVWEALLMPTLQMSKQRPSGQAGITAPPRSRPGCGLQGVL